MFEMRFTRWIGTLAFIVTLAFSAQAAAQQNGEPTYQLNMQDAEIKEVIDLVARVTGKSFIVDPRVRGRVTVISDRELTADAIYEIFLATIEVYGFSAVETDNAIKVIGQADIKAAGIPVDIEGNMTGEEIVTRVFAIQNTSAMELVPILRPLVARYGHLAGVNTANALIISDRATNIERVGEIIALLDQAGSEEIEVVTLEHAWVGNIITLLQRIAPTPVTSGEQGGQRSGVRGVHLVGDERSNRIIMKGEAEARAQIRTLIGELDIPAPENTSSRVLFLNNASAARMAELLRGLTGQAQQASGGTGGQTAPTVPVSILADEDLNALVVRAEPSMMTEIESIVNQLDVRRKQVLIEAAIVEVNGNISDALGIQWATNPARAEDGVPFASTNFSEGGTPISTVAQAAATGNVGALPSGAFMGVIDPWGNTPNFGVIIQAIESQSNTNLLSTPSVMTLDNSEAFITVGSSVPFKRGGTGSDENPFIIDRQDVGTTLTVRPHVQQDRHIRLEVDQVVESISSSNVLGAVDIITDKRQVKTEVLIGDGETIVLGGLIDDTIIERESRVPILGRIPILGHLFKSRSSERQKTNLMVILRPTIMEDNLGTYRDRRMHGIWEIRIETLDGFTGEFDPPTVNDLFDGRLERLPSQSE
ncbi:MAG: type II secretion system secretin GspD [Saccharospirillum sp.]